MKFTKEHKADDAEMLDVATKARVEESAERQMEEAAERNNEHPK